MYKRIGTFRRLCGITMKRSSIFIILQTRRKKKQGGLGELRPRGWHTVPYILTATCTHHQTRSNNRLFWTAGVRNARISFTTEKQDLAGKQWFIAAGRCRLRCCCAGKRKIEGQINRARQFSNGALLTIRHCNTTIGVRSLRMIRWHHSRAAPEAIRRRAKTSNKQMDNLCICYSKRVYFQWNLIRIHFYW